MKKFATSIVAVGYVLGGLGSALMPVSVHAATTATATANNITVIVEDKEISFDVPPQIIHDRTFVPLRSLAEALGATVDYDGSTRVATITKADIVLVLDFKTGLVTKNGTAVPMDAPPQIINSRTLVPLRFISQAFGNDVTYDAATHTASVLASQKTLEQRAQILDVLKAASTAISAQNSYEFNGTFQSEMQEQGNRPESTMIGSMVVDFNVSPHAIYDKTTYGVEPTSPAQTNTTETYVANGKTYMELAKEGWFVSTGDEDIYAQISNDPVTILTQHTDLWSAELPYMTMTEDATSQTIAIDLDSIATKKIATLRTAGNGHWDYPIGGFDGDQTFKLTVTIDKSTHLLSSMSLSETIKNPYEVPIADNWKGTFSKYGSVPTITVSQDILDQAKSL